jgi:protein-disulfide isomerase
MKITLIALLSSFLISSAVVLAAGSGKALGSPTASVTIELYSDFACPHCKEFHDETLPSLITDFVNTGKVYLVRHYFLLKFQYSRLSASYACAAEKIGKYNEVSDVLFLTQRNWGISGNVDATVSSVLSPADAQKVRTLAKDPSIAAEIERDTALGTSEKVTETPTMIIVHKGERIPVAGVISYPILKMYLEKVLAR